MVNGGQRPDNIDRLRLVPSFALRQFLQQKNPERTGRYERMSHERLVQEAESMGNLTVHEIDDLYENYRYGGKVSFYIYLIPENVATLALEDLSRSLEATEAQEQDEEHGQSVISGIRILDHEVLGDLIELRYKYIVKKHYLDENEDIQSYSESRFGFIWLDFNNRYLAMLSKDERVNAVLVDSIADLIGGRPLSVVIPKDLVNSFFSLDDLLGASHFDPITGTRRRISGRGLTSNSENRAEVQQRDRSQIRAGSLYSEQISEQTISALGVVSEKGKLYLLKTLPATALRTWAQDRLPQLVQGLCELQRAGSAEFLQTVKSNFSFSGIGQSGKPLAFALMERILTCRRTSTSTVPLGISPGQVLTGLFRFFHIRFDPYCDQCGNHVEMACPECGNEAIVATPEGLRCESCGLLWSYEASVNFVCEEGHHVSVSEIGLSLTLLPKELLVVKISSELNKIEASTFEAGLETFYIRGCTLHYLRQNSPVRFKLDDIQCFSTLPTLPSRESQEYKRIRQEVRHLGEVCISPGVTREMCIACVEQNENKDCLMKIFRSCTQDYMPAPHHGQEFGDVSFPTRLEGRDVYFKGLLKRYRPGEATPRSLLGKDILSQIITQDAGRRSETALAIVTATRLSSLLETLIEWLVRQYQGRVCIVKEEQLMQIFLKYREEGA